MTFKTKIIGGVAAAAIVLLFVTALSYISILHNADERLWVSHTHLVLETLSTFLTSLVHAESSQRDFILTGKTPYLDPYDGDIDHLRANLNELRRLTADNPRQQRALDQLEPLLKAELVSLQASIELRKRSGSGVATDVLQDPSVREQMDQVKAVISGMEQEERRLLVIRSEALERAAQRTKITMLTGEALGFLFLLAAGLVIHEEMSRRRKAEDEVRALNIDLERRVADRTAELAERAKDLERSNLELQQFAYVASHDLQEPLRTISSFTQLLAKRYQDKLDDKAREFIGFAVDGCKRMQTLINDLLAFSRVGTQAKPFLPTRCDEVVDRVLKSLKRAIDESGAIITREPLPLVLADEVQLSQLFQNLLGNALKFRGKNVPRIHLSAERRSAGWKILVRDNGIGISPEHTERIFVIFQRLHTKSQYPGTGIGLAICKKIAERHGGRIWVEPSPGAGSTFCFTISADVTTNSQELIEHEHQLRTIAAAN